ncbi:MAG: sulfotransferase family protein [Caulobacteraceae bacterium]
MALSVIGAGLPRTATWSLKLALEQLGFGPCYHMSEALDHPEHWDAWEQAFGGGAVDFDALFAGYGSTTDAPGCHFYRELAELYPEAKVVLGVRDPERWFASTQNTILSGAVAGFHGARGSLPMVEAAGWGTDPRLHDRDYMLDRYHRHNEAVKADIPADRLLVYSPSEGWEPLCEFLGVAVPAEAFPQVNSTEEFRAMIADRVQGGSIAER